jgi:hypothetical protein
MKNAIKKSDRNNNSRPHLRIGFITPILNDGAASLDQGLHIPDSTFREWTTCEFPTGDVAAKFVSRVWVLVQRLLQKKTIKRRSS